MPINSFNRAKTITLKLDSNSQSGIIPIYQPENLTIGSELLTNYKIISYNSFIKNLKAYASIKSIDEAALPNFTDEDSDTDKLYKTLDVEWKSPRKQITLYIKSGNIGWFPVGSTSLLNPAGYPYRIYNLMDLYTDNLALELGSNGSIGVSIDGVGYGLLTNQDTLTIHGNVIEEIFVTSPDVVYSTPAIVPNTNNQNNNENNDMANWIIKNSNYTATAKDKIIADLTVNLGGMTITTPPNPISGQCFSVMVIGDYSGGLSFNYNGANFRGDAGEHFRIQNSNVSGTFIYHSVEQGWVTNLPLIDPSNQGGF